VRARFRADQGLELIKGETRGGALRGVLLAQGVEHCRHKEQSTIARSLELQGKLGSKLLFFIALFLSFFQSSISEGHNDEEFGLSSSFFFSSRVAKARGP
jgi:hypothetical protein